MNKKSELFEKKELVKKIQNLEFLNEQLVTEIAYLDQLMRQIGFTNGLETVKWSAKEIISQDKNGNAFPLID